MRRRSMLALVDKWDAEEAHPVFWATFVAVGKAWAAAESHGEFFDFPPVRSYPKLAQKPACEEFEMSKEHRLK
jgi:hypothetical protein